MTIASGCSRSSRSTMAASSTARPTMGRSSTDRSLTRSATIGTSGGVVTHPPGAPD
jgi:hypothetical protein